MVPKIMPNDSLAFLFFDNLVFCNSRSRLKISGRPRRGEHKCSVWCKLMEV